MNKLMKIGAICVLLLLSGCIGQRCGGITGTSCPSGYTCKLSHPDISDDVGNCIPEQKQIQCGGIAGITCSDGFICNYSQSQTSDGMGYCVPKNTS